MKKIFSIVVVLAVLLLLSSAIEPQHRGIKVGYTAPDIKVGDTTLYEPGQYSEGYTLIHFWASYDASSRIANMMYSKTVEQFDSSLIRYLAVSYEYNEALYGEIVKRDKLSTRSQYYDAAGKSSNLYEQYRLNKGFATYLIDAHGRIVAQNPDKTTIESILGQ